MKTVREIVRRLMPDGSDSARATKRPARWTKCPWWPPDVFAVAATLVSQSGCYAKPRFSASCSSGFAFGRKYVKFVQKTAKSWVDNVDPPLEVSHLWSDLVGTHGNADIMDEAWQEPAMRLLAIADEACFGIGFSSQGARKSVFAETVIFEHWRLLAQQHGAAHDPYILLPDIATSLCQMVPISEACVQPKSVTSQVGCTLRSLSHNLALLPGNGEVASSWLIATDDKVLENDALNLLLIPFPFVIDGNCFVRREEISTTSVDGTKHYFFALEQKWMIHEGEPITARQFADHLLLPMVRRAREEVGSVNAVVLPETALTHGVADELAKILETEPELEFFIAGALEQTKGRLPRNVVAAYFYGEVASGERGLIHKPSRHLGKCHRWCLEQSQVRRYHLGHALQPQGRYWWERIDIEERACRFHEFRQGATLAAMVCEDLARFEPVHPVVRSVGPNLVIVLVMDGPQLKNRWPGHYAGVLADDPGSSVLTLTSLGMVRRSVPPGSPEPREIALWKQPSGEAQEMRLPAGHQGLILTLSVHKVEHMTLDGRSDGGSTRRFELSGIRPIKVEGTSMDRFAAHFS
jgi:hypothetical protein